MNIFYLDRDPVIAAQYQCNKHVVKMVLESTQLLSNAQPFASPEVQLYMHTHMNHPCSVWVRESRQNYLWLADHANELCAEYTRRYDRVHKCEPLIAWCRKNVPYLPDIGMTAIRQCMPKWYQGDDSVEAYRRYYVGDKARFAKWEPRARTPHWWPNMEVTI